MAPPIGDAAGKPVTHGTPSAWGDISAALETGDTQATIWFRLKGEKPMPPVWRLRIEFAIRPAADAIVRTFEEQWERGQPDGIGCGDVAAYVMPGNVATHPDKIESTATVTGSTFGLCPRVASARRRPRPAPKHLSIESEAYSWAPRLFRKETMALARMGINAVMLNLERSICLSQQGPSSHCGRRWHGFLKVV